MSDSNRPRSPNEPTAWLRQAVGDALASIDALRLTLPAADLIVMPLSGRSTVAGSREDRTCDRCGLYVPRGPLFYPFALRPRQDVVLFGGLCRACCRRESRQWAEPAPQSPHPTPNRNGDPHVNR